jgi:hypothetical protein
MNNCSIKESYVSSAEILGVQNVFCSYRTQPLVMTLAQPVLHSWPLALLRLLKKGLLLYDWLQLHFFSFHNATHPNCARFLSLSNVFLLYDTG